MLPPSPNHWSCAFSPPSSCSHGKLFQDSYKRTNRTNRTKIVRCFPHCCPHHRTRSYCCTSLHLTVSVPDHDLDHADGLAVYARFRTDDDHSIHVRDVVPVGTVMSSVQSTQAPTATWVTSRMVGRSKNVWVFEINPDARWFYAWNSGATMAQRLTRHVLEAVAVVPCATISTLQVVAVALSPTFTFASFRHAVDSGSPGKEQSYLFRALSLEHRDSPVASTREDAKCTNTNHVAKRPAAFALHEAVAVDMLATKRVRPSPALPSGEPFALSLRRLIEWVAQLPASTVSAMIPLWQAAFEKPPSVNSIAPIGKALDATSMAAHLVWWIHTNDDVRRREDASFVRAERYLGDPTSLRRAYIQWMDELQRLCDQFLAPCGWSFETLLLATARSKLTERFPYTSDRRRFIACVCQHVIQSGSSRRWLDSSDKEWISYGTWSCDFSAVQVRQVTDARVRMASISTLDALSIRSLFVFWTQCSSLRFKFSDNGKLLRVQSTRAPTLHHHCGLELILDHQYRCFATLPNGEPSLGSSLLGDYTLGDYIGFTAWSSGIPKLHVTVFAWPHDPHALTYRCHFTIRLPDKHTDAQAPLHLTLRVDVADVAVAQPCETPLRVRDKLALVKRWRPQYTAFMPYQ